MLTPEPGTIVGEKYRIVGRLGEGGMGTVYEAENLLTLKRAAIKWLHPRLLAAEEAAKRLLHEARATARIRHRNVVDIYDVLQVHDSVCLVMELLIGEPLSTRLGRGSLEIRQLVQLLLPAMRGMEAAHDVGVVHRDVKPDNIFLAQESGSPEPVPKVIDFGISRVFVASDEERLTRSGMTMGTPRYVSYEQLRGARDVDVRADVYAFGVILYEGLVGYPPYEGTTLSEQAIRFATTCPQAPHEIRPELPIELSRLVMAAIEKERDARISTMHELIAQLEPFADAAAFAQPQLTYAPRADQQPYREHQNWSITATLEAPRTPLESPRSAEVSASLPDIPARRRFGLPVVVVGVVLSALLGWRFLRLAQPSSAGRPLDSVADVNRRSSALTAAAQASANAAADVFVPPNESPLSPLPAQEADAVSAARPTVAQRDAGQSVQSKTGSTQQASPQRGSSQRRVQPSHVEASVAAPPAPLRAGGMSKQEF